MVQTSDEAGIGLVFQVGAQGVLKYWLCAFVSPGLESIHYFTSGARALLGVTHLLVCN